MNFLNNVRILPKIMGALGLFAILALFISGFGSVELSGMAARIASLNSDQAESMKLSGAADKDLARLHQLWLERLVETDPQNIPGLKTQIEAQRKELGTTLESLRPLMTGADTPRFAAVLAACATMTRS